MARGGNRPGAGRPLGATNIKTLEAIEALTGQSPLEYLTSVYQNTTADEAKRIEAAKAAAPYVHAKLTTTTLQGPEGGPVETVQRIERVIIDPATPD